MRFADWPQTSPASPTQRLQRPTFRRRRAAAFAAALVCVASGSVAALATRAEAQTAGERQCRAAIARASARYTARALRAADACHRRRSKGALPLAVNCNDPSTPQVANALARARQKLQKVVAGASGSCAEAPAVLSAFVRCPSPAQAADDGGATDGIDTLDELGACLAMLSERLAGQAGARVIGAPRDRLRPGARRCQKALGKHLRRLVSTYAKERSRCQSERDAALLGLTYGCDGYDGDGRIAAARSRFETELARHCDLDEDSTKSTVEEVDAVGACGDTVEQLRECAVGTAADGLGAGAIAMAYELPGICRAGAVVRISNAGTGSGKTSSSFSGGWNGIGHGIDLTDRFRDAMRVACDEDCATCSLSLDALAGEPDGYCRCANDPTRACDTIGPDSDDCGSTNDACQCFLGPPVAVSAGGAPACITVRIDEGHGGTLDLGSGDWANTLGLSAVLHLGTDLLRPCPVCENDPVPRDGSRGGTCSGGVRNGGACDINAVQPTFGPSSYDCPPSALTNISGKGLGLRINMTTDPSQLDYTLPCDSPGGLCPCRVCSGDTTLGCSADSVCAEVGAGTCSSGGGAGVQPNACSDRICSADGLCTAGPVDRFCDGETYADGRGYVACLTDIDCALLDAGGCSLFEPRRCYPDPIASAGAAGFFGGIAGTVGCLGLTNSAVVNQATGLPGAIRVVLDFETEVRCATDPSIAFQPPTGANCPDAPVSTTTTTTLLPPIPCALTYPLCGGDCPAGTACTLDGLLSCACL